MPDLINGVDIFFLEILHEEKAALHTTRGTGVTNRPIRSTVRRNGSASGKLTWLCSWSSMCVCMYTSNANSRTCPFLLLTCKLVQVGAEGNVTADGHY